MKEQINELLYSVVEVKLRVIELDDENRRLKQQIAEKATVKRTTQFGYYFVEDDPSPLCPKCYELTGKLIHLPNPKSQENGRRRICSVCDIIKVEIEPVHSEVPKRWRPQY